MGHPLMLRWPSLPRSDGPPSLALMALCSDDPLLRWPLPQVAEGPDGHPELTGHPLLELQDDFEPLPSLAGHLVPQQVNLWMGHSKGGSSSGLHHDFHDNLCEWGTSGP
jgi:hypothetical protein